MTGTILSRVRQSLRPVLNNVSKVSRETRVPHRTDTDRFDVPSELACAYLETRSETQLTSATIDTYENQLKEYTEFLENHSTAVVDVEYSDIVEYVEWCVKRGNRQSTIVGKITTIKELYKFIRLRTNLGHRLALDPIELEKIDLGDYNTPPPIEREPLTRREVRQLFDAMDSYRDRLLAVVGTETGLRNSDLRNLRLSDVDFESPSLHVCDPKNSKPYDVPISRDLAVELRIWCEEYREAYGGAQKGAYLFPGQANAKIETNEGLNQIIKDAAEAAGIQEVIDVSELTQAQQEALPTDKSQREWHRVTVHTLRHTCLTLMKEAGVPLQYRQLVANHSKPTTTQGYSHGKEEEFDVVRDHYDPPR